MRFVHAVRMWTAVAGLVVTVLAGCGGSREDSASANVAQPPTDAVSRRQALAVAAATETARPVDTTALLNWAERSYPQYFPDHQEDQNVPPYIYRYYPQTGNYVGVSNGRAMVLGPVSGGVLTDVGAVSDFRCVVYAWECQPNPLLTAKWQTGVSLESGDETPILSGLGIDDAGRATVLIKKERNGESRLFASQTLTPDAKGIVGWKVEQVLDVGPEFREPMTPRTTGDLHVAANGIVVVTWGARGPCLPGTVGQANKKSTCDYVMANRYDPKTAQWSGALRVAEAYATYSFEAGQIDTLGNFGVLVRKPAQSDYQLWTWDATSAKPSATPVALPTPALQSMRLAINGRHLYLSGSLPRNGKFDFVVYRGTAETGFGAEELLESQSLQASFISLLVSPHGAAIARWSGFKFPQSPATFAYAPSPTAPFVSADKSMAMFSTVSANVDRLSFNDAGELMFVNASVLSGDCQFWRLVNGVWQGGARWSPDEFSCLGYLPAENRNGDRIGTNSKGWYFIDSRTDSANQPNAMMHMIPGTSHIRPGTGQVVLSVNGTAVYVAMTSYDVLPTQAQPAGVGRAQVRNLWGWVLR